MLLKIRGMVSSSKRIVMLGFGFQPQNVDILIDYSMSHDPELVATVYGLSQTNRISVTKMIKRKTGIEDDELLLMMNARCFELMRDYNLLLES